MEKGYPIKTIEYNDGQTINEIVDIKKLKIPDSEFTVPVKYRKVGIKEFFQDDEEDDF